MRPIDFPPNVFYAKTTLGPRVSQKIEPNMGENSKFNAAFFSKNLLFFKGPENPQGVQISGFRLRQRIPDVQPVLFENVQKVDWGHRWAGILRQSRVKKGEKKGSCQIFASFTE